MSTTLGIKHQFSAEDKGLKGYQQDVNKGFVMMGMAAQKFSATMNTLTETSGTMVTKYEAQMFNISKNVRKFAGGQDIRGFEATVKRLSYAYGDFNPEDLAKSLQTVRATLGDKVFASFGLNQEKLLKLSLTTGSTMSDLADMYANVANKLGMTGEAFRDLTSDVIGAGRAGETATDAYANLPKIMETMARFAPVLRMNADQKKGFSASASKAGSFLSTLEGAPKGYAHGNELTESLLSGQQNFRQMFTDYAGGGKLPDIIEEMAIKLGSAKEGFRSGKMDPMQLIKSILDMKKRGGKDIINERFLHFLSDKMPYLVPLLTGGPDVDAKFDKISGAGKETQERMISKNMSPQMMVDERIHRVAAKTVSENFRTRGNVNLDQFSKDTTDRIKDFGKALDGATGPAKNFLTAFADVDKIGWKALFPKDMQADLAAVGALTSEFTPLTKLLDSMGLNAETLAHPLEAISKVFSGGLSVAFSLFVKNLLHAKTLSEAFKGTWNDIDRVLNDKNSALSQMFEGIKTIWTETIYPFLRNGMVNLASDFADTLAKLMMINFPFMSKHIGVDGNTSVQSLSLFPTEERYKKAIDSIPGRGLSAEASEKLKIDYLFSAWGNLSKADYDKLTGATAKLTEETNTILKDMLEALTKRHPNSKNKTTPPRANTVKQ